MPEEKTLLQQTAVKYLTQKAAYSKKEAFRFKKNCYNVSCSSPTTVLPCGKHSVAARSQIYSCILLLRGQTTPVFRVKSAEADIQKENESIYTQMPCYSAETATPSHQVLAWKTS